MKTRSHLAVLLVLLFGPAVAGEAGIAYRPTKAQNEFPRVRAARERRAEDIRKLFQQAGIDYPAFQVLLRVFKKDGLLELWVRSRKQKEFVRLKSYSICARSGVLGPKRRRGDLQVPEGFYRIVRFNPSSNFLLSMLVSYPNASDRLRGYRKNLGGDIFIHGSCVTIGCVPLTDRWIEELYPICLDSQRRYGKKPLVHIFPTRLDRAGLKWLEDHYQTRPDLLAFWKELEPGYRWFEKNHVPARYRIDRKGAYRFGDQK